MSDIDTPPAGTSGAGHRATRGRGSRRSSGGRTRTGPDSGAPLEASVYEGLAGFRSALRQFLAFSEVAAAAAGVTSQQYQAMLVVRTHPDGAITIKDLAEQMLLRPNGAVQLVDRLAVAALVERRPSPTDGRSVLVALTRRGDEVLAQLAADHSRELLRREPLLAESLLRLRQIGRQTPPK